MEEGNGFEDEGKVSCVIVTCRTADGVENVLLSRYYDKIGPVAQVELEAQVWEVTCQDVANIPEDEQQMVAIVTDRVIVFTRIADLVIYVVGCGALVDELVLSELLSAFVAVLRALMPKGPNSYLFLQSEYAKVHLALDDMVVTSGAGVSRSEGGGLRTGGFIDVLDPTRLQQMSALK